ncbi:MAG TPA: molybdopterin-dependent oxidoreductase, partial [Solirubrobacteraceae bacterium]|nr:molybdopterin-dependent oxidoreductase [Solirubrobacteraceae bacterium]
IIELCPVGALTSRPYRFRARPWDIEGSASICTLCPAQCNTTLTVRDERVLRVLARENPEVDDGWLCDKGRFAYQALHGEQRITAPMIRDGGILRTVSWERALAEAEGSLRRAGARIGALAGGGATNEEGLLLGRLLRDALGSPNLASAPGAAVSLSHLRALADPALAASVADIEWAHAVLVLGCEPLDDAPILDLRIRKGVRRNGVRLAVASPRASSLDARASASLRYAPDRGAELVWALVAALRREPVEQAATAAGVSVGEVRALAKALRDAGREVVVIYGEGLLEHGSGALLALAAALDLGRGGAGLIGIPHEPNGRGLREAGTLPNAGPGLARPKQAGGLDADGIRAGLAGGALQALYLLGVDPVLSYPQAGAWADALEHATTVIAHAAFLTPGLREHANVIFPSESSVEKEGTITHPDGRVQRLRPAVGHAGEVRSEWRVLAELAERLGAREAPAGGAAISAELFAEVAPYGGLSLEELGGHGVRWPERAGDFAPGAAREAAAKLRRAPGGHGLRLGGYRSIWASPEVAAAPALAFLAPRQHVELHPADAAALELRHDEDVYVSDGERRVRARVALRDSAPAGTAFLEWGLPEDGANRLHGPRVTIRTVASVEAEAEALIAAAAAEAELEPSEAGAA